MEREVIQLDATQLAQKTNFPDFDLYRRKQGGI
jgi:hypothetical protein